MAFTIQLLSDVRGFLKGTRDVEKGLDDVADSLDTLAADTATDADAAGDKLAASFREAYSEVRRESRKTGQTIGDDIHDGTRRAGEGVEDLKQEAHQTARETMASFDGSAESIGDMFQEVAANAFAGFGPAGAIAGMAAAAGIGIVFSKLQEADEQSKEFRQSVVALADSLLDVGGNIAKADLKSFVSNLLMEGLDKGTTRLQRWVAAGVDASDAAKALAGDHAAGQRVLDALNASYQVLADRYTAGDQTASKLMGTNREITEDFKRQTGAVDEAGAAAKATAEATDGLTKATGELSDAQKDANSTADRWAEALGDNLNVAADGLDKFVTKGVLNLDKWAEEVKHRARMNARIEGFKVDVFPKLSPEAEQAFAELPTETQDQIAKAYRKGSKSDRKKIKATLEAEVDVKTTAKDTKVDPVKIPTTVDKGQAAAAAADAADAAQREANKDGNRIEFKVKVDHDDLQRAVDRAAASIHSPTIYVNVKTRKDVP